MTATTSRARLGGMSTLTVVLMSVAVVLLVVPYVPLVVHSVADAYFYPQLIPESWSLRAWRIVADVDGNVAAATAASIGIAAAVTAIALAVGAPAGRVVATRSFAGKRAVELMLLAPVLVPTVAVGMSMHGVFLRLGLVGSVSGVILAHVVYALPYAVLLSASVFANAELELEDQARSLGASWLQARLYVTLRLAGPGLAVAALFAFLVSWGQYALTLVIGGGRITTLPILLFATAAGGDSAVTSALALVHAAPALVFVVALTRFVQTYGLGHEPGAA